MELTNEQKFNAYAGLMLLYLSKKEEKLGLCGSISINLPDELNTFAFKDTYPELYAQKPTNVPNGLFWFPKNTEGFKKRVKCLEYAINSLVWN